MHVLWLYQGYLGIKGNRNQKYFQNHPSKKACLEAQGNSNLNITSNYPNIRISGGLGSL